MYNIMIVFLERAIYNLQDLNHLAKNPCETGLKPCIIDIIVSEELASFDSRFPGDRDSL